MREAQDAAKTSSTIMGSKEQKNDQNKPRTGVQLNNRTQAKVHNVIQRDALSAAYRTSSIDGITFSEPKRNLKTVLTNPAVLADPRPPLPAMKQLALTWIHIPYTHTGWVRQVLARVSKKRQLDMHSEFLKQENWASNHNQGRHAAPHAKFVKSAFVDLSRSDSQPQVGNGRIAVYVRTFLPIGRICIPD